MAYIYYAVLALKKQEVDGVVKKLTEQKMENIAKWLQAKKDDIYGNSREDWKPFVGDMAIRDLMKTKSDLFQSATLKIDQIDEAASDLTVLLDSNINLYVIDVFALFLDRYINLAPRVDLTIAKQAQCCLVIPYIISMEFKEIHDLFITAYSKSWTLVYTEYRKGSLSRTVMKLDDLMNLREYLYSLYEGIDRPDPSTYSKVGRLLGSGTTEVPRNG